MKIATALSSVSQEGVSIRGYELTDLVRNASFAEVVGLMLSGVRPGPAAARMLEAILVCSVDHGLNAPSIHITRASASCGVPLATAVASGVSSIGEVHGGAGEDCARMLQEAAAGFPAAGTPGKRDETEGGKQQPDEGVLLSAASRIVRDALERGENLPGYGHRVYRTADPRSVTLFELAEELGLYGPHCRLAELIAGELERLKGKRLVLNVDGAQAAVLSDLGFPWSRVRSLFLIGRTVGLCAHAAEELESGVPLGYLSAARVEESYTGPGPRRFGAGEDRYNGAPGGHNRSGGSLSPGGTSPEAGR